jgi:hypothetical protein
MAEQLVFDLPVRPAMGRRRFLRHGQQCGCAGAGRRLARLALRQAGAGGAGGGGQDASGPCLGGAGRGADRGRCRSDEALIAEDAGALAVEDADRVAGDRDAETKLFHLHNAMAQRGAPLLITARTPPSRWGLGLPDLDSRMRQASLARIEAPDDALVSALLLKLSHDRGLALTPAILSHVLPRIERSAAAVAGFVDRLDARPGWTSARRGSWTRRPPLRKGAAPVSPSRHNP